MLKTRDICAIGAILWLFRLAWRDPNESLSAHVFLSWYIPQNHIKEDELHALPSLFDVDGDQKPETLAVIVPKTQAGKDATHHEEVSSIHHWVIQVRDLKPAGITDKTHMAPFKPKVLYESQPIILEGEATASNRPLALVTGHVDMLHEAQKSHSNKDSNHDRTRHYFCGTDWHDAASKCGTHCPKGQATDCANGESCYADTPCDAHDDLHGNKGNLDKAELHYTAAGSIPSVFVMWHSGTVTMHSLVAPKGSSSSTGRHTRLELEQQWTMSASKDLNRTMVEWDDASMDFLDAVDTDSPGMVVLTGYVDYIRTGVVDEAKKNDNSDKNKNARESATATIALNAKTGKVIWDAYQLDEPEPEAAPPVLPMNRGTSSNARRRSMVPSLEEGPHLTDARANVNCLHAYKRSLLTSGVLPYMYMGYQDAGIHIAHFTHHDRRVHDRGHGKGDQHQQHWQRKKVHRRKAHLGRPNVIVSRNYRGLHVRSLKNGHSVCHLSLWDNTLYGDLNHDGTLDSVQTVMGEQNIPSDPNGDDDEYKFYKALIHRVGEENNEKINNDEKEEKGKAKADMCHLIALSGVPNKEELFAIHMCGNRQDDDQAVAAATVMALESTTGKGHDLVVPLSNGRVSRYRGTTGRRMWHILGATRYDDFPEWKNTEVVRLDRIATQQTIPATRPIVISGDSSLALLSPSSGSILATATFPQHVVRKPLLMDFNADGTTDVVAITTDAIWGYRISVKTGASIFFRILVGLLMAGMMLAVLKNRFGTSPGKRGTDL